MFSKNLETPLGFGSEWSPVRIHDPNPDYSAPVYCRGELEERVGSLARFLDIAQEERARETRTHEAALLTLRDDIAELRYL